ASAARAGERPTTIMVSIAVTQPRTNCNRRPPSFTPVDPLAGLTQFRERPRQVELYGDLRRFRGPPAPVGGGTAPAPRGRAGEQAQEFHEVAIVTRILRTCGLVSMRACAAAACASGNVLSISGLTRPAAISGSTCSSTARAIAPWSGIERARRVEPVWVRRLSMMRRKSTV